MFKTNGSRVPAAHISAPVFHAATTRLEIITCTHPHTLYAHTHTTTTYQDDDTHTHTPNTTHKRRIYNKYTPECAFVRDLCEIKALRAELP